MRMPVSTALPSPPRSRTASTTARAVSIGPISTATAVIPITATCLPACAHRIREGDSPCPLTVDTQGWASTSRVRPCTSCTSSAVGRSATTTPGTKTSRKSRRSKVPTPAWVRISTWTTLARTKLGMATIPASSATMTRVRTACRRRPRATPRGTPTSSCTARATPRILRVSGSVRKRTSLTAPRWISAPKLLRPYSGPKSPPRTPHR